MTKQYILRSEQGNPVIFYRRSFYTCTTKMIPHELVPLEFRMYFIEEDTWWLKPIEPFVLYHLPFL